MSKVNPPDGMLLLQKMQQLLSIAPRKLLRVPLSIQIHLVLRETPFIAYTENISVSGMLFYSEALLSLGDIVTCSFFLPDSTHITINAEVMKIPEKETEHDTTYYGVKFIEVSIDARAVIAAFIKKESNHNM